MHLYSVASVVSDSFRPFKVHLPSSSVHGIFQARILEKIATSSRLQGIFHTQGSSQCLLCLLHCRWTLYLGSHYGCMYLSHLAMQLKPTELENQLLPGASVRKPTRDKVMRQRSDGQGESNLRASPWYFLSMYPKKPKSAGLCTLLFHSCNTLWKKSTQGFSLLHLKGCFNPKTLLMAF